jgi:DNA invertase Pin-like site-specific DNA recombinase
VFTFVSDFSCGKFWSKRGLSEVDFQRRPPGGGRYAFPFFKNAVSGFSGGLRIQFEAYCRVSTNDQDYEPQLNTIKKVYLQAIAQCEKVSGKKQYRDRPVLDNLVKIAQPGDKIVVWKLDRLARSLNDLLQLVDLFTMKQIALEVLDQRIDTSTASGLAFLQMLGVFAEFETNLRSERQRQGIEKAKKAGKYKGRKIDTNHDKIRQLYDSGLSNNQIAQQMNISISTVYRVLTQRDKVLNNDTEAA